MSLKPAHESAIETFTIKKLAHLVEREQSAVAEIGASLRAEIRH